MNDQNRVEELLKSALSHHRTPSFLPIQERAMQPAPDASPSVKGRVTVLRRLAFSCCALVLAAWGLGMLGTLDETVPSQKDAVYMAELSSAARTEEDAVYSRSYSGATGASSAGAILYNILPSDKLMTKDIDAAQDSPTDSSEESSVTYSNSQKNIGPALLRAMDQDPDGVFDVVADIENADQSSEAVSHLLSRFLLYLDTTNYYIQINAEQIQQYAQQNIKLMLVGQGLPVRPQGYPEAFDVGSAWIYNNSPDGTQLSVILTSPLPTTEQGAEEYTSAEAAEYLAQVLPEVGITAPDPSSYIDIVVEQNTAYATYAASLDRQSALAAVGKGVVTQIQAIPCSRSANPVEQQYYYMVYGDGWVFSN